MVPGTAKAAKVAEPGARGIALVVVLWMLTLLAVIAASFTTTTRTETRLARNLVENAKAEALARLARAFSALSGRCTDVIGPASMGPAQCYNHNGRPAGPCLDI